MKVFVRTRFLWVLLSICAAFIAGPAAADVVCPGAYGGHLQGIAVEPGKAVYWSFTVELVKTDLEGNVLKQVPVPSHHGDPAYADGKVYVAVNLGQFNKEPGHADSWVYVYDAGDLSLIAKHETQEVVHGAGGMDCHDGHFYVIGGLPEGYDENYAYEYDGDLAFVKRHVIDSGYTLLGIQTACRFNGYWWFGCYGNPRILLQTDDAFRCLGRYEADWSVGIAGLSGDTLLRGITRQQPDTKRWAGRAVVGRLGTPVPGVSKTLEALMTPGGEPVRVVCFGDSVTGVYYHTGGRRTYTDMVKIALERTYPQASITAINAGISGHTTQNALARIDNDVLRHKPHLVTVMFGLNDMTRVPIEEYESNLATIIQQCRDIGAEVLLCTPNCVYDTQGRPIEKLEQYVAIVRKVAAQAKVPVVDCYDAYQALRAKDPLEWALIMSDEIHPNMDGHKKIAGLIAQAISGYPVSLDDMGPPCPGIPKTVALLEADKPVRAFAMPPFDKLIGPALQELNPTAKVEVTPWAVDGQGIAEIEQAAKNVRKMDTDLVIVAVPADARADTPEQFIRAYSWVLNWSLSFGRQEWDCFAVPPSVVQPDLNAEQQERDRLARGLIKAQDLAMLDRAPDDDAPLGALLAQWLQTQAQAAEETP